MAKDQLPEESTFQPYLPEDIGLDMVDPWDAQLYVDSEGDVVLAVHLLSQRKLDGQRQSGDLSFEEHDCMLSSLNDLVAYRRDVLHQYPRP